MFYALIFIFGLIIGSFLNVCIYRIPKKESVVFPASHCTSCSTKLKPIDLIPVFSWLLLKGKCRYCNAKILKQYPLVELLTAVLFVFLYSVIGLSNYLPVVLVFTALLIVVSFIDYQYYLIPNKLILVGFVIGLMIHIIFPTLAWQNALLGFVVGGGVLYVLAVLSKGGMGGGDIKLAALIGFYLGWQKVLQALFFGALLGSVFGILMILTKKIDRKTPIPFGPFLSMAVILTLLLHSLAF
jgi:leader peptidase (prepilin peptidase)/N-methyltransferase